MLYNFSWFYVIFKIPFFSKTNLISLEGQIDWIQIRPDILSGLIWVQVACKGYKPTTPADK